MKSASKKSKKPSTTAGRELLDHPDQLLDAIMKAVGDLQAGERLEIRRVKDPNRKSIAKKKAKAKKKVTAQKTTGRSKIR